MTEVTGALESYDSFVPSRGFQLGPIPGPHAAPALGQPQCPVLGGRRLLELPPSDRKCVAGGGVVSSYVAWRVA